MKKIVFVEKEQKTYDPVTAFFNKKTPSLQKNINTTAKPPIKPTADKRNSTVAQKNEKATMQNTIQQVTPKIGAKTNIQHPIASKPYPTKDEVLKTRDLSKTNLQRDSKGFAKKQENVRVQNQQSIEKKVKIQEDSIEKLKEQEVINKVIKGEAKIENSKSDELIKKIQQLQRREQQYLRKIEQFEVKEQKYIKNQQKLAKIQKDMKSAAAKNKQGESALQKLKEKQSQIKEMLEGNTIPFNRKREVILGNKIRQLKRLNRQLTKRLKNYKGTDLVQLAIQQNRQQITMQLYTVDVQKQLNQEMNIQMQSLITELANKLNSYLQKRTKQKGQKMMWAVEQSLLLELTNLSQQISLNFLNNFDLCPLPKSNQQALSVYSIVQQYKTSNQMKKVMDRFNLNFQISKQNMETLQQIQAVSQEQIEIKTEINNNKTKKNNAKNNLSDFLRIYQQKSNITQILLIQNICQLQFLKQWIDKVHSRVSQQLYSISKIIGEIKDIVSLGPTAKQSLYLYLQTNLSELEIKFPSLKIQIKQIQNDFSSIQRQSLK